MKFVLNSTPLIHLTKVSMAYVFKEEYTTPEVKNEVVDKGKKIGAPDALLVEKIIEGGKVKVIKPKESVLVLFKGIPGLHPADAEVLALAKEMDATAIIDDKVERGIARMYGIKNKGSAYFIFREISNGKMTKEKAKKKINEMIKSGWRCSIEDYQKIMSEIDKL